MRYQRGGSVFGFIGFIFLLFVAFKVGAMVQARTDVEDMGKLLATACDTREAKSDSYLLSSNKVYNCEYVRDMTPQEMAAHKKTVDESVGVSAK
jgi:hypothetical protein